MKAYTLHELFRLTRTELLSLHREIAIAMAQTPRSSADYTVALENLQRIRWVLAQPRLTPL